VLVDAVAEEGLQFIPTHPELFQVRTFFLAVIALGDFVPNEPSSHPHKTTPSTGKVSENNR
jgi:hypothetical protein